MINEEKNLFAVESIELNVVSEKSSFVDKIIIYVLITLLYFLINYLQFDICI